MPRAGCEGGEHESCGLEECAEDDEGVRTEVSGEDCDEGSAEGRCAEVEPTEERIVGGCRGGEEGV